MCSVRSSRTNLAYERLTRSPVLATRLWVMQECTIAYWRMLSPDGVGTTKVRDTRFRADSCARKGHDVSGLPHQFAGILKLFLYVEHMQSIARASIMYQVLCNREKTHRRGLKINLSLICAANLQ